MATPKETKDSLKTELASLQLSLDKATAASTSLAIKNVDLQKQVDALTAELSKLLKENQQLKLRSK